MSRHALRREILQADREEKDNRLICWFSRQVRPCSPSPSTAPRSRASPGSGASAVLPGGGDPHRPRAPSGGRGAGDWPRLGEGARPPRSGRRLADAAAQARKGAPLCLQVLAGVPEDWIRAEGGLHDPDNPRNRALFAETRAWAEDRAGPGRARSSAQAPRSRRGGRGRGGAAGRPPARQPRQADGLHHQGAPGVRGGPRRPPWA